MLQHLHPRRPSPAVAAFVKGRDGLINLKSLNGLEPTYRDIVREGRARRSPPMAPDTFRKRLREGVKCGDLSFTWPTDEALVANLYERAFRIELGSTISLVYCGLGWGDEEVRTLIGALQWATDERISARVRTLDLKDNPITREPLALQVLVNRGADSMGVLTRAVRGGMLSGLRDLHVDRKWCEESLELRKACRDRKIKLSGQHVDVR